MLAGSRLGLKQEEFDGLAGKNNLGTTKKDYCRRGSEFSVANFQRPHTIQ